MITVTLQYPNGQRQEAFLSGVPRVGEHIRMKNGMGGPSLVVEHVLWIEGKADEPEPTVLISVRQGVDSPAG